MKMDKWAIKEGREKRKEKMRIREVFISNCLRLFYNNNNKHPRVVNVHHIFYSFSKLSNKISKYLSLIEFCFLII